MKDRKYALIPDSLWPLSLSASKYRPRQLYACGTLPGPTSTPNGDSPIGIAMVGTRRPTANAPELCRALVESLKGTRAVIISGLAQGIDSLCHEAALNAGIPTIAVLAQGLATRIEGSRGDLACQILEAGGALISEFDPDEPAYKGHFPARNRIISGISSATVIVQSKAKGGALITADLCFREGKPLIAVPGDFDNENATGPNQLLDEGRAKPVFAPRNLYKVLGLVKTPSSTFEALEKAGCVLTPNAKAIFMHSKGLRKTFQELQDENPFSPSELLAILTELELAGFIETRDNYQFYFNGAV